MQRESAASGIRARIGSGLSSLPRGRLARVWRRYYWVIAGMAVTAGVLAMGRPFVRRYGTGPPLPHTDTVILEYAGWYVAQGHTLYTDIWEIKPPVAYLPPYVFAHLTGSNMYAHHVLGIATSIVAVAATGAFLARTVGTVTDSPEAGVAAAMVLFVLPDLFYLPWMGYKAKYLAFGLGMAALDQAVRERYATSGVLAGLSVGIWQLALLFPILTTLYSVRQRSVADLKRHVAGGLVAVGITVGTLLLYADSTAFIAEVVLGPLALQTKRSGFDLGTYYLFYPGDLIRVLTVFGLGGLAVTLLDRQRASARPLALGGVLVVGVLLADFDGLTDVFYPLVFTAVGVGIVVSYLPRRVGVSAVILLGILVMPAFAPTGLFNPDPVELEPTDGTPPALGSERESVYWTNQSIQSCHFFASGTQRSVLEYYPADVTLADLPCGNLDFYWAMTRHRLLDHPRPTATEIPSTKPSGPSQPSASTPAQTSTPAPTQTSTPTPTPTPQYIVVDDVLDYRVDDNATVVTVPVANRAKAEHTVSVVATVTLDREPHQRCKQITLAGSEQRTLRFRFGDVDPDTGDVSIEIRIEDIDSETACE